ncbi:MAG TPA: hypothetical protein VKA46_24875 [Gemmataceae bacterium]|nr:hypothetical protein [Gemmataceae bacterium]
MFLSRAKVGLLLLAATTLVSFAVVSLVAGEQPKKDDPAAADKEVIDSKATPRTAAATVKFRKELGLPYPSLNTLGSRIDAARRAHDPVALAHAANELSVAEKVSGKKASLLAKELVKESAQLAALRRQETELRAVTTVAQSVADTDDTVTLLKNILASAKAQAAADSESIRMNQEPTWTPRKVIVNNYTTQYIDVWVNGYYKVQVGPGLSQSFMVEHRWNPTVLTGYGDEDSGGWGPINIWGRFKTYTWNIN